MFKIKDFCTFLLFLLMVIPIFGQTKPYSEEATMLFGKKEKIQWVKHFRGYWGETHEVWVTLANNGKEIKGLFVYASTLEKFYLEGFLTKDSLQLIEFDKNERLTARISLAEESKGYKGLWFGANGKTQCPFEMHEVDDFEHLPIDTASTVFLKKWTGFLGMKKSELTLVKWNRNQLVGVFWQQEDNLTYDVKGRYNADGRMTLQILKHGKPTYQMQMLNQTSKGITFKIEGSGKTAHILMALDSEYPLDQQTFAWYAGSISICIPKATSTDISEEGINKTLQTWIIDATSKMAADTNKHYRNRNIYTASIVFIPHWIGSSIISGLVLAKTNEVNKSFVYACNLRSDKPFEVLNDFKSMCPYSKTIDDAIFEFKSSIPTKDQAFKNWISQNTFEKITVLKEGLGVNSEFDGRWGNIRIPVEYSNFKKCFKSNSVFNKIIE